MQSKCPKIGKQINVHLHIKRSKQTGENQWNIGKCKFKLPPKMAKDT